MAASNLMAFAHHGNASWEEVQGFKQTVVRLVSLLSAMMLAHLEGTDTLNSEEGYDILDLASLHMTRVRVFAKEKNKTEVVIQWLKLLIIERLNVGDALNTRAHPHTCFSRARCERGQVPRRREVGPGAVSISVRGDDRVDFGPSCARNARCYGELVVR